MSPAIVLPATPVPLSIVVFATRDRARNLVKDAFPRRRTRLTLARNIREFEQAFRASLVDAALVDLGGPTEDVMRAIELAREFPSAPFFALTPFRPNDAALAARAATYDFADLIVEGLVLIELKSVEKTAPVHRKQVVTYIRLADKRLGLLINFGEALIKDGITRLVNGLTE